MDKPEENRTEDSQVVKWYRRTVFLVIFAIGGVIIALGIATEVTSQPEFCGSHHYIRPYYESWTKSTHNQVPCGKCHFPPGIKGTLQRKWKAVAEVAIFVTKTYKGEPRAEVSDDGCLRQGCHVNDNAPMTVDFKGIPFDHNQHLPLLGVPDVDVRELPEEEREKLPRGRVLRCASCHSQIVQAGEAGHMTVTESTCFLCHFKNTQKGEPISGCPSCHEPPKEKILVRGIVFDHQPYVSRGIDCTQCHVQIVEGDGSVPTERCYQCHDRPERLKRYDDHVLIHQVHVTEHKLDCLNCHLAIKHEKKEITQTIDIDCQTCHQNTHSATQTLYMGLAEGVEALPDPMFLARVGCVGCHRTPEGDEHEGITITANAEVCAECHGQSFEHMEERWATAAAKLLEEISPRLIQLRRAIDRVEKNGRISQEDLTSAKALYDLAERNIQTIRNGNPVHNVRLSEKLVLASNAQITMAFGVLGLKDVGEASDHILRPVEPEGGRCLGCHFGIETVTVNAFGRYFPHENHVLDAQLACDTCHSSSPLEQEDHGETRLTRTDCATCHHDATAASKNCLSCHDDLRRRTVRTASGMNHAKHALDRKIDCGKCHSVGQAKPVERDCVSCHHQKEPDDDEPCLSCHKAQATVFTGAMRTPPKLSIHADAEVMCIDCHPTERRQILKLDCSECHDEEGRDRLREAWQSKTRTQITELRRLLRRKKSSAAAKDLRLIEQDHSFGVHNPQLVDDILTEHIDSLKGGR